MIRAAAAFVLLSFTACLVRYLVTPDETSVKALLVMGVLFAGSFPALYFDEMSKRHHALEMKKPDRDVLRDIEAVAALLARTDDRQREHRERLDELRSRLETLETKAAFGG